MIQIIEQSYEEKVEMYMKCTKKELAQMLIESNTQLDSAIKNCNIPVVVASVKITKCKTFKHVDPCKQEEEITKWLSSNKIVIKHTTQSQFKQRNRSSYGDYYTYGTLITIFYEDE